MRNFLSKKVFPKIDVTKKICDNLLGETHSKTHRFVTGTVIMSIGVGVTKAVFIFDLGAIHFIGDVIGYGLHGIGAIPFAEHVMSKYKTVKSKEDDTEESES